MGHEEAVLYHTTGQGGVDTLARKILRGGKKVFRDYYKFNGKYYWVLNGRVLTREEGDRLHAERKQEGRAYHPSDWKPGQG